MTNGPADTLRDLRQCAYGNAQVLLSEMALYKIPALGGFFASSADAMDGNRAVQQVRPNQHGVLSSLDQTTRRTIRARCEMTICIRCGSLCTKRDNEMPKRWATRKYCGRACSDAGRRELAAANMRPRFESLYIPEPMFGCWIWLSHLTKDDYAAFSIQGKTYRASRVSYSLYKGPIPPRAIVRHRCDNVYCVNPDHLELGTQADNMTDKVMRGRQPRGSAMGTAKINEEDAMAIFVDRRIYPEIAAQYGLSLASISMIKRKKNWTHIHEVA